MSILWVKVVDRIIFAASLMVYVVVRVSLPGGYSHEPCKCVLQSLQHTVYCKLQNPIPKKACLMPKVAVMVATRVVFLKRGKCYQNECNWHFVYAQICESRAKTLSCLFLSSAHTAGNISEVESVMIKSEMSRKIHLLINMCKCVRFMPECCCVLQKNVNVAQ